MPAKFLKNTSFKKIIPKCIILMGYVDTRLSIELFSYSFGYHIDYHITLFFSWVSDLFICLYINLLTIVNLPCAVNSYKYKHKNLPKA